MHQGCHQQRPFLRDACSTEKEGFLHKETLRAHQGTASPGNCGPFSCLPLRGAAEPSRGEQRTPLPAPASSQRLSFSFRSFLSGRRVAVRAGAGDCCCHSWVLEPLPAPTAASSRAVLRSPHLGSAGRRQCPELSLYLAVFLAKGLHLCSTDACEDVFLCTKEKGGKEKKPRTIKIYFCFFKQK